MSAQEWWTEKEFIALLTACEESPVKDEVDPVNLSAERQNPVMSWDEFAGNFQ